MMQGVDRAFVKKKKNKMKTWIDEALIVCVCNRVMMNKPIQLRVA